MILQRAAARRRGHGFALVSPLGASSSGQQLPIAVLVFVPERQSPRSAVCPTPSGPLLPASSHARRLVSPGLSFRRPSRSCPCLSATRRSPRCRSATAPAGGVWLTFHASAALDTCQARKVEAKPSAFLSFSSFCFFFSVPRGIWQSKHISPSNISESSRRRGRGLRDSRCPG